MSAKAYNNSTAIQTVMAWKNTPSPEPLISILKEMEKFDSDDMLKRSPDIAAMLAYWDKVDAIIEGQDCIVSCGETYLKRFRDEEDEDYQQRLRLTKFTNIYRDILEGLVTKPFEEEVSITSENAPPELDEFIEDVDGSGNNLTMFAFNTFFNGVNSAIDWIFVDYPTINTDAIRTIADLKKSGIRPFWTHVLARNVLEVKTKNIGGNQVISYIRIFEPGIGKNDNYVRIFERDEVNKINEVNKIKWSLFVEKIDEITKKKVFVIDDTGYLSIDVIPLVPFITGRRDGASWKIFPPMQDAADLQIQLYQDESALKYIKTLCGYPMLAANGMRPDRDKQGNPLRLRRGPNAVLWGVPDANGSAGSWDFVTPPADIMTFLQSDIDKTKQDLRELGRQPLTATSGNLTVITTAIAAGKSRSAVSAWALTLKDALENALQVTLKFMKIIYDVELNVYNEFDNFTDGASDIQALNTARTNGDLSRETYWSELKRRKVLSPEFDAEIEEQRLLDEIPGNPDMESLDDTGGVDETPPNNLAENMDM